MMGPLRRHSRSSMVCSSGRSGFCLSARLGDIVSAALESLSNDGKAPTSVVSVIGSRFWICGCVDLPFLVNVKMTLGTGDSPSLDMCMYFICDGVPHYEVI